MATILLEKEFQGIIVGESLAETETQVFGDKVGFFASLFGCWHKNLTRPFTLGKTAYRSCLDCGARKPFNTDTLMTERRFYYPPIVKRVRVE